MPATATAPPARGAARRAARRSSRCAAAACRRTAPAHRRCRPAARGGRRAPRSAARTASPVPSGGSCTTVSRRRDGPRHRLHPRPDHDDRRRRRRAAAAPRAHARSSAARRFRAAPWGSADFMRVPSPAARMMAAKRGRLIDRARRKLMRNETRSSRQGCMRPCHSANTQIVAEYERSGAELRRMSDILLVFDLDGTLVDSVPDLANALNEVLRERGYAPLSPRRGRADGRRRRAGAGRPRLRGARRQRRRGRRGAAALHRNLRGERDESDAALSRRAARRWRCCAGAATARRCAPTNCSGRPRPCCAASIWPDLFDGVAGGDRYPVKKPDKGHLLGLIAELGGSAERAVMIGDSENDAAVGACRRGAARLMRYGYARVDPATLGAAARARPFRRPAAGAGAAWARTIRKASRFQMAAPGGRALVRRACRGI